MLTSLLRDASETAGVPGYARAFALWEARNEKLREAAALQTQPLRPALIHRDEVAEELEEQTLKVAGHARHYASEKNLGPLAAQVRLRPSTFRVLGHEQRVQLARMVHDTVEPLVSELADYGITAEELAAFKTIIDRAQEATSAPRKATVNRRGATSELREAFRAVDAVIKNHLTPLLRPLRRAHPGFYERYLAALAIVDHGGRSRRESETPAPAAVTEALSAPAPLIQAA